MFKLFFQNSTLWKLPKHYNYISWYSFLCVCTFSTANRSRKKLAERRRGWHQGKQIQAADYLIKACVWGVPHTRATAIGYTVQTAMEKFRLRDQGKGRQLAMNWKNSWNTGQLPPPLSSLCVSNRQCMPSLSTLADERGNWTPRVDLGFYICGSASRMIFS